MAGKFDLAAALEDAEAALVQGEYFKAEKVARKALSAASRLPDRGDSATGAERAAAVLLQALFETSRFPSAKPALGAAFGSLSAAPPATLLLWLALALDTEESGAAQSLLLSLLRSGPARAAEASPAAAWTRRHHLAALHLYVIEILLPALRDPSEVCLWLRRQAFLPLDPRERAFLEDEVEAAAGGAAGETDSGGAGGAGDAADGEQRRRLASAGNVGMFPDVVVSPSKGGGGRGGGEAGDDLSMHSVMSSHRGPDLGLSPVPSPLPLWPSGDSGFSPPPSAAHLAGWPVAAGSSSGGGADAAAAAVAAPMAELDWLGRWQQAAFTVADSVYSRAADAAAWAMGGSGGGSEAGPSTAPPPPPVDAAAAAAAAVAALLAWAAYAERETLGRAAARAWRGLGRGAADLLGMGLTLTPNPLAAPRHY